MVRLSRTVLFSRTQYLHFHAMLLISQTSSWAGAGPQSCDRECPWQRPGRKVGGMRGEVSIQSAHCRENLLKNSPESPYLKIIFILLLKTLLLYKLTFYQ